MVKKFVFVLLAMVFFAALVSASTPIHIQTAPFYDIRVTVADGMSTNYVLLDSLKGKSNYYGEFDHEFEFSASKLDFYVFVYIGSEKVATQNVAGHPNGELLNLTMIPEGYDPRHIPTRSDESEETENVESDSNETIEEIVADAETDTTGEETIEEPKVPEENKVTQLAIFGEDGTFNKNSLYYIFGGFIVLALLGFFIGRQIHKKSRKKESNSPKEEKSADSGNKVIKVKKLSEWKEEKKREQEEKKSSVADAEKRLKELEQEIEELKESEKLDDLNKKIQEKENQLREIRGLKEEPNSE